MTRNTTSGDDRWRDNNRALRAQRGLSASDRRELLRTAKAAVLGLFLIATATVVAGATFMAPVAGQLTGGGGSVLDPVGAEFALNP